MNRIQLELFHSNRYKLNAFQLRKSYLQHMMEFHLLNCYLQHRNTSIETYCRYKLVVLQWGHYYLFEDIRGLWGHRAHRVLGQWMTLHWDIGTWDRSSSLLMLIGYLLIRSLLSLKLLHFQLHCMLHLPIDNNLSL